MPWADVIIILVIITAAVLGYHIGLLGAFKGFIGSIVGLIAAWLLTPLAQAWLEGFWGIETKLASFLAARLPESLQTLIRTVGQTARTLQDAKESLLSLPLPSEVIAYLQRALAKTPADSVPSPELMVDVLTREISQSILWALLFAVICSLITFIVRKFLGTLFVSGDGKTFLGVFDGLLGMIAATALTSAVLVILCGLIYPIILMSDSSGGIARIYPYLLDSRLVSWLAGIYQGFAK
jgi:hypothetical protein